MKKSMRTVLATAIILGITGTALAGPFADVPAGNWAYEAVNKLAAAGIIDGYGDGTYKGDKTITRYEMAQIVAKAMEHSDKADAANKALINKLADEYAQELDSLGVRVTALENKVGNIKWTGQVREWYQNIDEPKSRQGETRILLWANAQLTKDLNFTGRFSALSGWGEATGAGVGAQVSMDNAYLSGKSFTLGRQPITLGKGLVYNIGYDNDGVTFTIGDKVKLTGAAFKSLAASNATGGAVKNILAANVDYKVSDDFDLTGVYAKNASTDQDALNTWAAGFEYKGINNLTLIGEYGQNNSDYAKAVDGSAAKAWVAQAKIKGADWSKPHTYGFWVGYRDADDRFNGITGDPLWETPYGIETMNNIKGVDYGFEYTVFKNAVVTLNYLDLETKDVTPVDKKSYTAQLRYFF